MAERTGQAKIEAKPDGRGPVTEIVAAPASGDTSQVRGTVRVSPAVDRKSTRLNSSHTVISYAVFCLKKKKRR